MIVTFALDREAVTDKRELLPVAHALKRLLRRWDTHGMLICGGLDEVAETVNNMPIKVKRQWQEALKESRKGNGYWWRLGGSNWSPLHTIESVKEFNAHCSEEIELACVTSERADTLGVAVDRESTDIEGVEVVRFPFAPDAQVFDRVNELSQKPIRKGTTTDTVWVERFAPLARACKRVVIVDRYAASEYRRFRIKKNSGIQQLLERLSRIETIEQVSIFTGEVDDSTSRELVSLVQSLPGCGLDRKDEIVFLRDEFFKKHQHARYIRFDHLRCVIDAGIGTIFGQWDGKSKTDKFCEFSLKSDRDFHASENNARLAGQRYIRDHGKTQILKISSDGSRPVRAGKAESYRPRPQT